MNSLSRLLSLRFWSRLTFRLCLASLSGVLNLFPRPSVDPFLVTRRPPPFEFRRLDSWKQLTIMQWQLEWKITYIKIQSGCLDETKLYFLKSPHEFCDKIVFVTKMHIHLYKRDTWSTFTVTPILFVHIFLFLFMMFTVFLRRHSLHCQSPDHMISRKIISAYNHPNPFI